MRVGGGKSTDGGDKEAEGEDAEKSHQREADAENNGGGAWIHRITADPLGDDGYLDFTVIGCVHSDLNPM